MLFVTVIAAITSSAVFTITAIIIVCLATPSAVPRSSQNEASDLVMKMRPTKHPSGESQIHVYIPTSAMSEIGSLSPELCTS